eukprot:UN24670
MFMNFQDMIIWFYLEEITSIGSVLRYHTHKTHIPENPSFCPHRRFSFRAYFPILGQPTAQTLSYKFLTFIFHTLCSSG